MRAARGDCTTQEPSRLVKITRLFFEIPILSLRRRQLERKSTKKHSAGGPQIAQKSILGHLGRPKPFRERVGTHSGRFLDAQVLLQSRSWGTPGEPRAARSRPKASPGRPEDAPRPSWWLIRALVVHRTASNASSDRFLVAFFVSRENSDVPRVPVFTVFCWVRTKLAPNVDERQQTSKVEPFGPPKSRPGASCWLEKRARATSGCTQNAAETSARVIRKFLNTSSAPSRAQKGAKRRSEVAASARRPSDQIEIYDGTSKNG